MALTVDLESGQNRYPDFEGLTVLQADAKLFKSVLFNVWFPWLLTSA